MVFVQGTNSYSSFLFSKLFFYFQACTLTVLYNEIYIDFFPKALKKLPNEVDGIKK